jgi:2-dehydro-3-deoxyphosphogluconate aldolase/(4S)-4-hydroxy-2-oxoglutarate aldolase
MMNDVLKRIGEFGLVPVVKIENSQDALSLGRALCAGGLPVAEITFRTAAAEEVIKILTKELPELFIGAGTILTLEHLKRAVGAGAQFIVSPGFNPKVVDYCIKNNITVIPGVNSPTGIEMALERGLKVVKFFPAEASGGLKFLKAIATPYSGIQFFPTGGINAGNLNSYLYFNRVHACGGTWIVNVDLISMGKFDEITKITKEAVGLILGFEFAHLGINEENSKNALTSANTLSELFNFPVKEGSSSVFVGSDFEVTKKYFLGKNGHIAISTNDINRAIAYLKRNKIKTRLDTAKEEDGRLKAIYIDKEVSGFAIHLMQK